MPCTRGYRIELATALRGWGFPFGLFSIDSLSSGQKGDCRGEGLDVV